MKTNFEDALRVELVFEGGKADVKGDPGGRTNAGVTQRTYAAWRANNGLPAQDVFAMSDAERDAIYRLQYGDKVKFDDLPAGIDLVMLDGAVNSGVAQAVKWVQRALGALYSGKVDGVLGEGTFAAIQACNDHDALIGAILDRREAFLRALKTFKTFGDGWISRVTQLRKIAQAWATGSVPAAPEYVDDMHRKAELADAKKIPTVAPATGTATAGATVAATTAAATGVFGQIKAHLETLTFIPHADQAVTYVDHASAVVAAGGGIAGILTAAAGGAWFWYAKHRATHLRDALDAPLAPAAA